MVSKKRIKELEDYDKGVRAYLNSLWRAKTPPWIKEIIMKECGKEPWDD